MILNYNNESEQAFALPRNTFLTRFPVCDVFPQLVQILCPSFLKLQYMPVETLSSEGVQEDCSTEEQVQPILCSGECTYFLV